MGMSLSVDMGLGLEIETDSDLGIVNQEAFAHLGEESYDWDQALRKTYPLLQLEQGYSFEFTTGAAMFVKRLYRNGYYGVAALLLEDFTLTQDEENQLRAFSAEFQVPYEPKIIAFPNYR